MAKYDQGGGCACGVQKVGNCEHAGVPLTPRKAVPLNGRARIKITDAMVEAAIHVYFVAGHPKTNIRNSGSRCVQ